MLYRYVFILVLACFSAACGEQSLLSGTYSDDGERLALLRPVDGGKYDTLEVVSVSSGKFAFSVKPEIPNFYYLALLDKNWNVPVFLNSPCRLNIPDLAHITIDGSETQKYLDDLTKQLNVLQDKQFITSDSLKSAKKQQNANSISYWQKENDKSIKAIQQLENQAINEHADDLIGVFLIWKKLAWLDYEKLETKYMLLSENMRNSREGRLISYELDRKWKLGIGVKARNFTLENTNGELVSLFDIPAKLKLVDFWASWCVPCLKANKELVKVYEKYKDKGLEIVGISADKNENNWKNAIKNDGYKWIQLWDKGKGDLFDLYKVSSIPRWFLLDENNVCIAEGNGDEGLAEKIAEELAK